MSDLSRIRARHAFVPPCALLALALGIGHAHAQAVLEEMIVTAERKEESLQETPISVIALDSALLEQLNVSSIMDLGSSVPNLKIMPFGVSATTLRFFIRGVGTVDSQITLDSPVGIYMDGVYMSRSVALAMDVADIERVEVLRGPQGTLYGRNTTGGAVNIVTARPGDELAFSQLVSLGDYDMLRSRTSINVPLGDSAAAKLSYQKHQRDGWIRNTGQGGDWHEFDKDALRFDLRWHAGEDVTVDYSYDRSENDFVGNYYHLSEVGPNFAGFLPEQPDRVSKAALPTPYEDSSAETSGHTLTIGVETALGLFKSITAYREVEEDVYQDFSGNPIVSVFTNDRFTVEQDQFSQEFQLIGAACDDRVDYIAGLYYLEEDGHEVATDWVTLVNFPLPRDIEAENDTWAIYGQAGWRPATDSPWKITLGLRYTEDERSGDNNIVPESSDSYQNFTPALTVMYDLSETSNLYAKVVSGYKAGGYNMRQANFSASYDEETLVSYELGWKTELLERRMRWNGAVFYSDYDDMQLDILVPGGGPTDTQTQNAGTAEIYGLETELTFLLTDALRVGLSYGYLNDEINEVEGDDASLYHLPNAPKHMFSALLDWQIASFEVGDLSLGIDYNWQDDSVTGVRELRGIDIDAYGVAGARLALSGEDWIGEGGFKVAAWVRNAFDEEYPVDTFGSFGGLHANRVSTYGEPRTWGVDLEYRF